MRQHGFFLLAGALLFAVAPGARANTTTQPNTVKGDLYGGYSRQSGMNGWQFAMQVTPSRWNLGIEGDISNYNTNDGFGGLHTTLIMVGPRATFQVARTSLFAHVLGGYGYESNNEVFGLGTAHLSSAAYAFGGGADFPFIRSLKLRVTGDYLVDSSGSWGDYPYRIGAGVAYHF